MILRAKDNPDQQNPIDPCSNYANEKESRQSPLIFTRR